MRSGIYKITNLLNGKIYIGSAINLNNRLWDHKSKLRACIHANQVLQRSFNKHGEEAFRFETIEYCESGVLIEREQHYLDTLLFAQEYLSGSDRRFKKLGYNIKPIAGSCLGYKHTKHSRQKMSLAKIGLQAGDKHPLWGKKFTDESKALKSKAMKNKYLSGFKSYVAKPIIQLDLKGNFIRVWESATEVQKTLGYSRKALVHALGGSERTSYGYKWIYKHKTKTKNEIADPSMCRF